MRVLILEGLCAALLLAGCASLHHYQLGDIDASRGELKPFEIQVDETGLDTQEAMEVGKAFVASDSGKQRMGDAQAIIALFQFGYVTGDPTFDDDWADGLLAKVLDRCPSGRITGLSVVRESMDYPVVSGEIVTLKGYCIP
jgi:hypothetical protein